MASVKGQHSLKIPVWAVLLLSLGCSSFSFGALAFWKPVKVAVSDERKNPGLTQAQLLHILSVRMPRHSQGELKGLAKRILQLCRRFGFKASFVLSTIQTESTFRSDVVSSAGAVGLMQLMPSTAQFISDKHQLGIYHSPADLENPLVNVTLGIHYLAYLNRIYPHTHHTLAAYNIGPARFRRLSQRSLAVLHRGKYITSIKKSKKTLGL